MTNHGVRWAIAVMCGAVFLFVVLFVATSQVSENTADIGTVCDKVNAVNDRLDKLVAKTTENANAEPVHVVDPAVQQLIDEGRKRNEEFKAFDAKLSAVARCKAE